LVGKSIVDNNETKSGQLFQPGQNWRNIMQMSFEKCAVVALFLGVAFLPFADHAQAQTVTSQLGTPDPGPLTGQTMIDDFDTVGNQPGYSWTGNLGVVQYTYPGYFATPAAGGATHYGIVTHPGDSSTKSATFKTPPLSSISFYWGSIDGFNSVEILGNGGIPYSTIVSGGQFAPADGDQVSPATNRRVNIAAGPGQIITGLRFISTGITFEFDNIAVRLKSANRPNPTPSPSSGLGDPIPSETSQ
jgi:hypothetical protein